MSLTDSDGHTVKDLLAGYYMHTRRVPRYIADALSEMTYKYQTETLCRDEKDVCFPGTDVRVIK